MKLSTLVSKLKVTVLLLVLCLSGCKAEVKSELFVKLEKLAQTGNPDAQYHLGMMYNNGLGVKQDPRKAFDWFTKAADSGNPLAAYKVGCYYAGEFQVVPLNREKSLSFKLIAANAGYSYAQTDVGNACFEKKDYDEAIKWWKLAAAQGYLQALNNLSIAYYEGQIVPENKVLAHAYYKLSNMDARKEISPDAQIRLDEIAESMTADELKLSEKIVSDWTPERTPLTVKAESGMSDAMKLVSGEKNTH